MECLPGRRRFEYFSCILKKECNICYLKALKTHIYQRSVEYVKKIDNNMGHDYPTLLKGRSYMKYGRTENENLAFSSKDHMFLLTVQ